MRSFIRKILFKTGLLNKIKYNAAYLDYKKRADNKVAAFYENEFQFYSSFLKKSDLIFDIGGNDGHKTDVFLRLADKVVCCEPDDTNFKILTTRFNNNTKVKLEKKALAETEGTHKMYVQQKGSAFNTLNKKFKETLETDNVNKWKRKIEFENTIEVPTTTLDRLIEKYGKPYFIKIDVEGYELEVIKGLTQSVPFISIECLYPDFYEELKEIIERVDKFSSEILLNISVNEKLVFTVFQRKESFLEYLEVNQLTHFETIIQMH